MNLEQKKVSDMLARVAFRIELVQLDYSIGK